MYVFMMKIDKSQGDLTDRSCACREEAVEQHAGVDVNYQLAASSKTSCVLTMDSMHRSCAKKTQIGCYAAQSPR